MDFSQHFPTLSLPSILHELSTPKSYKAHIPGAGKDKEVQTLYLEMLTHLLRKDLVVQLHTYILILVPEYIKIGCSAEEYENMMSEDFSHGANGGSLTPTLESPTVIIAGGGGGGQAGSAKSADFAMLQHHQQQQYQYLQQQLMFQKQQAMPSQTYRFHSRSSTGPGSQGQSQSAGGPPSAGVAMSSSFKSHLSMPFGRLLGKRQDASWILPNPGQASETEREWVIRMCKNQPQNVSELFMRYVLELKTW
jgi:hypothetical protein